MVRTSHVYRERPPDVPNETEESGFGSEIGDFAKNGRLYAPVTATKPLQATANRHRLSWTAANYRQLRWSASANRRGKSMTIFVRTKI